MIANLDIEYSELAQSWKAFIRHVPAENRVVWEERPQTATDVQTLVRNLHTLWISRPRQRVASLCDRFIPTVDSHSQILAVLPDGNLYYTPLLYGVLQSVIKVSCTQTGATTPNPSLRSINPLLFHPRHRQITIGSSKDFSPR